MATGVLLVTVGKATKLFDIMQEKQKTYVATFEFGYETDSLDATGITQKTSNAIPKIEQIEAVLPKFKGKISQIPPLFSAKSVNGVRAYDLARRGESFELKPKQVEVFDIKIVEYKDKILKLEIVCGSGTYIRSICRDIAYALGTFATMTALERTASGFFTVDNCIHLDDFLAHENPRSLLIPSDEPLRYEKLVLDKTQGTRLLNGLRDPYDLPNGKYCVYCEDEFWGVGIIEEQKLVVKPYVRG
jgi:tRNA pseudouridine55 synthase